MTCLKTKYGATSLARSLLLNVTTKEITNCRRYFVGVGFQREVAGVVKVNFSAGVITPESLGTAREKERVVLAPDCEQRRPLDAEVFLKPRVERDIAGIIEKQIQLNLIVTWASQQWV